MNKYYLTFGYYGEDGETREFCQIYSKNVTTKQLADDLAGNGVTPIRTIKITENEYINAYCYKIVINTITLNDNKTLLYNDFDGNNIDIKEMNITYYLADNTKNTKIVTIEEFKEVFKKGYRKFLYATNNIIEITISM